MNLRQYIACHPHVVLYIVQSHRYGDEVAICRRIETGVYYPAATYSRYRDAVRALRALGYTPQGKAWTDGTETVVAPVSPPVAPSGLAETA